MGKALRLSAHPRAIQVAKMIERGERSFDELHIRDKMVLYDTQYDLDGLVTTEELLRFRLEVAQLQDASLKEKLKLHAKLQAHNVRQKAPIRQ